MPRFGAGRRRRWWQAKDSKATLDAVYVVPWSEFPIVPLYFSFLAQPSLGFQVGGGGAPQWSWTAEEVVGFKERLFQGPPSLAALFEDTFDLARFPKP